MKRIMKAVKAKLEDGSEKYFTSAAHMMKNIDESNPFISAVDMSVIAEMSDELFLEKADVKEREM